MNTRVSAVLRRFLGLTGAAGAFLVLLVFVVAVFSMSAPYDPSGISHVQPLQKPGVPHWLGTDHLGRDVLLV
ncbi:MAG: D,D-dipeptide ABC transporter permease, partial [Methylobacteriaceae bacterium]|nr:D,D-dipeptide ABC transporter permease [Methylobacteriaceae bacterium]